MITRTVTPSESGKRLHRYLCTLMPNYPLGQIFKMIDQGKVRVNGKRKKQNYEMSAGDELTIFVDEETFAASAGAERKAKFIGVKADIDVVYEDDELLVVNKPAGVLTHPDQTEQKDTLITRVHAYLYRKDALDSRLFLPATANRLDRNTSGLVLVGKTAGMLHRLNQWVQRREIGKYYVTIVQGALHGGGTISAKLERDSRSNRTVVSAKEEAMEATTRYEALQTANGYTLVEIELESGRTHQIRSHLQSLGHPLLGDVKYGGRPYEGVNHQLLHAWKLVLPDGRAFTAPPPSLFGTILRKLRLSLPET
ncbi:RluA family pseudouridine synthase [Paenibacillus sp.]|uniref:RluA family pseudouridine synthase n=1 Tax=Paenibacillus sp. TaxID=58172 RepID=UPI002D6D66DA|nr:RluA family pseudouridine synthase [Paenibacillus sp.]HZG56989.1 RluA family pseudouridine synthase [Paenibacillus sp.]